jgi:hypothetical protein
LEELRAINERIGSPGMAVHIDKREEVISKARFAFFYKFLKSGYFGEDSLIALMKRSIKIISKEVLR